MQQLLRLIDDADDMLGLLAAAGVGIRFLLLLGAVALAVGAALWMGSQTLAGVSLGSGVVIGLTMGTRRD